MRLSRMPALVRFFDQSIQYLTAVDPKNFTNALKLIAKHIDKFYFFVLLLPYR